MDGHTPIHASKPSVYKYHPLVPNFSDLTSSKTSTIINPHYSFYTIVHFQILYFIMGVFTYEAETTTVIPPARLFKAFVLDADNLIPKIAPQAIKSSQFNYVKHRIDEIDNANFTYGYSLIEGDALTDKLEKISYEIKLVASPDGGSILKSTSKYHTKGDHEIKEEQIKAGKEKAAGLFKAVEGYLLANTDAYN
ncbi:major allergen pru ar 1 [Quercus suber]|uniref:Major allergen pru ar 1 n=1 Tax=Quercus suber TaxID=58331 RepID=A0AAW0LS03_QUESU